MAPKITMYLSSVFILTEQLIDAVTKIFNTNHLLLFCQRKLSNNQLEELPAKVFAGLKSLKKL